jgi:hypothetical protein
MPQGLTLQQRDEILAQLGPVFGETAAEALVGVLDRVVVWRAEMVTRQDFRQLQELMAQLLEGQRVMQESITHLQGAVAHLAEAQAHTEERVARLEEAQIRAEERMGRLEGAMTRLVEAQSRTETGLQQLTQQVGSLQTSTDTGFQQLTQQVGSLQTSTDTGFQQLTQQVGGLSETVGGDIEDMSYNVLPEVLNREFGWEVGTLERVWQQWDGEAKEVNIFGQARDPARPEQTIWIVGEAKHNLTLREVERFAGQVERARQHLTGEIFPVCFCYRARPEVQARLQELGIRLVFSMGA